MTNISDLDFEMAYAELQTIIARLESGELTLEESVALFERGSQLSQHCQILLDDAELRVSRIADNGRIEPLS